MAQYYLIVNHTKEETVDPSLVGESTALELRDGGDGLALLEYLLMDVDYVGSRDFDAATESLFGSWRGDSIGIVGDSTGERQGHGDYDDHEDITEQVIEAFNASVHESDLEVSRCETMLSA